MHSAIKLSVIALAAAIFSTLPVAADSGLLGGGGLLGTGIGTPGGALGTGLLSGGGTSGGGSGGSSGGLLGNGGVLGSGVGAPGGALGTGLLSGSGGTVGTAGVSLGSNGGLVNPATVNGKVLGVDSNVLLDLFGPAGTGTHVALGGGLLGDGLLIDLFGGTGGTGGNGGGGNGGGNGGGGGGNGGNGGAGNGVLGSGIRVASLNGAAAASCFAPDAGQIAKLVNRHAYVNATFASWEGASSIKVVSVHLCPAAAAKIASQRNINRLQSFISTQASLAGRLQGHNAAQVIGVDRAGNTLVVYVM